MNPKILGLIRDYQTEHNEEDLIALWEAFRPLVINMSRRFHVPMDQQADVYQDAFLLLIECAKSYSLSQQMPFEGYYKMYLQFHFLNRTRKTIELLVVDHNWSNGISMTDYMAGTMVNTHEQAEKNETCEKLEEALEALTNKQRQAVSLFYLKGLPLAKIADQMGCSYGVAYKHKRAGLINMRTHLEGSGKKLPE